MKTSAKGGSAAGGKNFWRLRIGVRRRIAQKKTRNYVEEVNLNSRLKASEFVLKKNSQADQKIMENVFQEAIRALKNNFDF